MPDARRAPEMTIAALCAQGSFTQALGALRQAEKKAREIDAPDAKALAPMDVLWRSAFEASALYFRRERFLRSAGAWRAAEIFLAATQRAQAQSSEQEARRLFSTSLGLLLTSSLPLARSFMMEAGAERKASAPWLFAGSALSSEDCHFLGGPELALLRESFCANERLLASRSSFPGCLFSSFFLSARRRVLAWESAELLLSLNERSFREALAASGSQETLFHFSLSCPDELCAMAERLCARALETGASLSFGLAPRARLGAKRQQRARALERLVLGHGLRGQGADRAPLWI